MSCSEIKDIDTTLTCSNGGCSYDAQGNYSCQVPPVKETFSTIPPVEEAGTCGGPFRGVSLKFKKKSIQRR